MRTNPAASPHRASLTRARRVVVKVGTRVLTHDDGRLALTRVYGLVEDIGAALADGREVILVSSGAVGLGCEVLGFPSAPADLATRQMCAAVGQSRLLTLYQQGLDHLNLIAGQVLISRQDFGDEERRDNLTRSLEAMLDRGILPVVNENDVVSTDELALGDDASFGDNDRLSALVASHVGAELLILLTDVDGVFDGDPAAADSTLVAFLDDPEGHDALADVLEGPGRGGMRSKLDSAALAARSGCQVVIASGRTTEPVRRVLAGEAIGTWIPPTATTTGATPVGSREAGR